MVVSVGRRTVRVTALHLLDAALLALAVWLLAATWTPASAMKPLLPAVVAVFLLSLNALSAYGAGDARRDRGRLLGAVGLGSLILGCLTVFPPSLPLSGQALLGLGAVAWVALVAGRKCADQVMRQVYRHGIGLRRTIVIGNLHEVGQVIRRFRDGNNVDQYLLGHITPEDQQDPTSLGGLRAFPDVLEEMKVQEVLIATILAPDVLQQVAEACFDRGVAVFVVPSVVSTERTWIEPMQLAASPLLRLHPARLELPALMAKRAFDVVVAIALLLVAAPVMLLVALAVRADSAGPIFFRQERVGRGGRRFMIWKFRSMRVGADEIKAQLAHLNAYADHRLFKLPDDPRTTRVGRFLRRSSLDELPQLFNVLAGDMSLVGPRPPLPSEVESYEPHHHARLAVVPGITGPWQVGGRNLVTDFETIVSMERSYIESWSLMLDAKILLQTVPVVIRGKGAY